MTKLFQIIFLLLVCQNLLASGGEQRLSKKNIVAIFKAEHKVLLLNDSNGNLFHYNGQETSQVPFENNVIRSTKFLVSNPNFGIYSLGNTIYSFSNGTKPKEILSIAAEEKILSASMDKNKYYIATDDGIYIVDKKSNSNRKLFEGNIDPVRKVICGSERCFVALKNLVIAPEAQNNVVAEMSSNVLDLALTSDQKLLILTDAGLYILEAGSTKQLLPASGRIPEKIIAIKNSKRWLYLIQEQSVQVFDWINSEVSNLGNFSGQYSCTEVDEWSNLWLASSQGVWSFCPSDNFEAPHISGIKITDSDNKIIDQASLEVSSEKQLFNVQANLSYLPNHEQVLMQWRTEKGDWRPFKNDFALSPNDLSPGTNKIYIRAKSNNSDFSLPFSFEIKNALNSNKIPSYWYLIFSVLAALLLIGILSLFNLRSKQNEASLQIKQLKAQNELLQSKQQIDQLKMNPHFIFNALTSINGLIASGDIKQGRKAISLFSKFLRQFLNQSQDERISIEDEIQLLENYVNIELLCRDNSFDFTIQTPKDELLDLKIPNMIIQPFIENSIIHAFGNIDRRGNIQLKFEELEGYLVATIDDNGVGMNNAKPQASKHKSVAIDLVKQRLAQRDKTSRKSYVVYSDNNPGTSVNVYLKKI